MNKNISGWLWMGDWLCLPWDNRCLLSRYYIDNFLSLEEDPSSNIKKIFMSEMLFKSCHQNVWKTCRFKTSMKFEGQIILKKYKRLVLGFSLMGQRSPLEVPFGSDFVLVTIKPCTADGEVFSGGDISSMVIFTPWSGLEVWQNITG